MLKLHVCKKGPGFGTIIFSCCWESNGFVIVHIAPRGAVNIIVS